MENSNHEQQRKAFDTDRQADSWQEFLMTGRPSALATYLQNNGPVDEHVRAALIDTLRNGPALINRGGRDSWRDYTAFVAINLLTTWEHVGKTEACRRYAERSNQELRTVEIQYQRGEKIFGPESDLFAARENDEK
jgi:hypothetical protein